MKFGVVVFSMAFAVFCTTYNFIDVKPVDILGVPLTAGFMLVACSYIISDCITELYGRSIMMRVLFTTFCLHLITIAAIQLACFLPPNTEWGLNDAFVSVIGQSPKVALLSALAFLCGTSTNTYVMSRLNTLWGGRYFKVRALLSTVAGEFVDCCAYFPILFFGLLPWSEIGSMICVHTVAKCCVEFAVLPVTHGVVNYFKRSE